MKKADIIADVVLYAALFKDIAAWDESLHDPLLRDYSRIENLVSTRGISFIMIDMPEAGRVIDQALSRGHLRVRDLPNTFGKIRERVGMKEFLSCLTSKVFDRAGYLRPDTDPTTVYFLRQVLYLSKKVRKECSDAAILTEVESFKKVDDSLRHPTFGWDDDNLRIGERHLSFLDEYRSERDLISERDECPRPLLRVLDEVSGQTISLFREFDPFTIKPRHGPGAVADGGTGTDKYLFPNWPNKLERVFPFGFFGQSREDLHRETLTWPSFHEPMSRLIAVPKTLKGPRLIASEPIAHQYLQLGIMKWIRENLPMPLRSCIDFKSQWKSQRDCLRASISGDSATVDLSSASDRLSCWVVERIFQYNIGLLEALHASRTRALVNATGIGDTYHLRLKKFAPMGSGVTFPVQTICYALMCIACLCYDNGLAVTRRTIAQQAQRIRVFGDDIIMPSSSVESLSLLMTHVGLKMNASKTHWRGHFRESCGMDAWRGVDVTPLYVRDLRIGDTAEELTSWVDVCNNAYLKGLWSLSDYMLRCIPEATRKLIPISNKELGCLTLRSHTCSLQARKVRFNPYLHRPEVLGLAPEVSRVHKQRENHQSLLQYFLEEPPEFINWKSGWTVRNRFRLKKRWVSIE